MNKPIKHTLAAIGCILLLAILITIYLLSVRTPKNPPGTVGNTAGNLYNDGLFCERDGVVYFSNIAEGGSLYSMNVDESNPRLLQPQNARNILADGNHIYFFHTGAAVKSSFGQVPGMKAFARCDLKGKKFKSLTTDVVISAQLVDNLLYLLTTDSSGATFSRMNTDKSDWVKLGREVIDPACAREGKIYYNGTTNDHYLYCLDTATDTVSQVWRGNLWFPVLEGDYVYYLDVANNYRLCRYHMSAHEITVLTRERVDCFNVGHGYIYYQTNGSNPALKCMPTDGSDSFTVAQGIYTKINLTSQYAYFRPFDGESMTYHSPLGSTLVEVFIPQ